MLPTRHLTGTDVRAGEQKSTRAHSQSILLSQQRLDDELTTTSSSTSSSRTLATSWTTSRGRLTMTLQTSYLCTPTWEIATLMLNCQHPIAKYLVVFEATTRAIHRSSPTTSTTSLSRAICSTGTIAYDTSASWTSWMCQATTSFLHGLFTQSYKDSA